MPLGSKLATSGKLFTRIASPVSQLQETGVQKGSCRLHIMILCCAVYRMAHKNAATLCFTDCNFGSIDQIGTKFGTSQRYFILNINLFESTLGKNSSVCAILYIPTISTKALAALWTTYSLHLCKDCQLHNPDVFCKPVSLGNTSPPQKLKLFRSVHAQC